MTDSGSGWWLQDSGISGQYAACVGSDGSVYPDGADVSVSIGVRPALWLSLES